MNRRLILTLILLFCLSLPAGSRIVAENAAVHWSDAFPNGVAAGDVSQTSVVLWARTSVTGTLTFSVLGGGTVVRTVTDPLEPASVTIRNLSPDQRYVYTVTTSAGDSMTGTFVTPAEDGHHGLRFGASGDWRSDFAPYPSIANVPARNLDFFISLGDTVYADVGSPAVRRPAVTLEEFRLKHDEAYGEHLGLNTWASIRSTTSLYAIFDDHEVRDDIAGAAPAADDDGFPETSGLINETQLFRNGIQTFQEYNPLERLVYAAESDATAAHLPDFYRYRTFGQDAALFILDARTFRDAPISPAASMGDVARYLEDAFEEGRVMLGAAQLDRLKADLLAAEADGIVWKFIVIPEPIQHLAFGTATDRFEGYAAERAELLRFLINHRIDNVVFVTGDVHGTVINNVMQLEGPDASPMPTTALEVTAGPVAHNVTVASRIMSAATRYGFVTDSDMEAYAAMSTSAAKDRFMLDTANAMHEALGYDPIGLENAPVDAELLKGDYMAAHVYGWTEFEIDEETLRLTVTTYGVEPYDRGDVEDDPDAVISRSLAVVSRFAVDPLPRRDYAAYLPITFLPADD